MMKEKKKMSMANVTSRSNDKIKIKKKFQKPSTKVLITLYDTVHTFFFLVGV